MHNPTLLKTLKDDLISLQIEIRLRFTKRVLLSKLLNYIKIRTHSILRRYLINDLNLNDRIAFKVFYTYLSDIVDKLRSLGLHQGWPCKPLVGLPVHIFLPSAVFRVSIVVSFILKVLLIF